MRVSLLIASASFLCCSTQAYSKAPEHSVTPLPQFSPVMFSWSGLYLGMHGGYAFTLNANRPVGSLTLDPSLVDHPYSDALYTIRYKSFSRSQSGLTFGGQFGFNYQLLPSYGLVLGAEADIQYLAFDRVQKINPVLTGERNGQAISNVLPANSVSFQDPRGSLTLDYYGTLRGRFGYGLKRALIYGTAGFAYAKPGEQIRTDVGQGMQIGWAAGGGVEYSLPTESFFNYFSSSSISIKLEGIYVKLDQKDRVGNLATAGSEVVKAPNKDQFDKYNEFLTLKAGINYKFGTY